MLQGLGATLRHDSVLWSRTHSQTQKKEVAIFFPEAYVQIQTLHLQQRGIELNDLDEVELNIKF